jgi:peroxiredoxin
MPLVILGVAATASLLAFFLFRPASQTPVKQRDLSAEARDDLQRRNFRPLSGPLEALLTDSTYKPIPTQVNSLLGEQAPDFTLADTDGKLWRLTEKRKDGPVVLVFYYGYYCNHCVSQLFALNQDIEKFQELGATVLAISADEPKLTRERYKTYGAFKFPVLSDGDHAVAAKYGVYAPSPKPGQEGDLMHGTYVIDRQGRVVWANRGDGPFTENRTLLKEVYKQERQGYKP